MKNARERFHSKRFSFIFLFNRFSLISLKSVKDILTMKIGYIFGEIGCIYELLKAFSEVGDKRTINVICHIDATLTIFNFNRERNNCRNTTIACFEQLEQLLKKWNENRMTSFTKFSACLQCFFFYACIVYNRLFPFQFSYNIHAFVYRVTSLIFE